MMTLLHPHHPTHFLKVVGDSLARYVLLILHIYQSNASRIIAWVWVFVIKNNSNPYPHNYPTCVWSIYVKNNPTKVHFVLNIVKSHSERTKTNFARHYRPFLRTTGIQCLNSIQGRYVSNLFLCSSIEIFYLCLKIIVEM